jgi:glutamate carboxypeptidase
MTFNKTLLWTFIISSLSISASYADIPTSVATNIKQYTQQQQGAQLALLKNLVNINSGTPNIIGVYQVGEMLRPQLEQLGFKTWWVNEPAKMKRAGTLMAERKGTNGKHILLIAHLDTVFSKNSPFQQYSQSGNKASGPGVLDDKGGDVVVIYALKALQSINALNGTTITVAFVGDEEDSGKPASISRKPLIDAAKHSDVALEFEGAFDLNSATVARRGIVGWVITSKGRSGHSSYIFQKSVGDGAVFELARILNTMRTQLSNQQYLTFNPGLVLAGTQLNFNKNDSEGTASGKQNVIAGSATASGDLRYLTKQQKNNAEKTIESIVNQHLPNTTATVVFEDGIPAMQPTAGNMALLKMYSNMSRQLGAGPVRALDASLRGASDISYVASIVPANLAGLGPVGSGAHSVHETVDISTLPIATERAALLIYQLTR